MTVEPELLKLGSACGNGYYRWQMISGSVFTHLLTVLDTSKKDFGKTWLIHASEIKFPFDGEMAITWFPTKYNRNLEAVK